MSSNRSIRRSQLISPFGPGAIVDIGDESLLLTDLRDWPTTLEDIYMPRLTQTLGVRYLKAPPSPPEFGRPDNRHMVKTIRFPRWMFCPQCRHLEEWEFSGGNAKNDKPACADPRCKGRALVPMRFVAACENGHMSDVPWYHWAHSGQSRTGTCDPKRARLFFRNDVQKGSGLDALFVKCDECGSRNDLGKITSPGALKGIGISCTGAQPWEPWDRDGCDRDLTVLQRGASNLYYPITRSALDIPNQVSAGTGDIAELIESNQYFGVCRDMHGKGSDFTSLAQMIADDLGESVTLDDVIALVTGNGGKVEGKKELPSAEELQLAEWTVLSSENVEALQSHNFIAKVDRTEPEEDWGLATLVKRVVLLERLREVRAFCGYERVKPGVSIVKPAGRHDEIRWLPAIEVFGEGIFIELDQRQIGAWLKKSESFIGSRLSTMQEKHSEGNVAYLPEPTPQLVLLHTLAHLLIRQLSFECGYSSGSIRERIYAADGQAGILIYTADSDAEGSLGGLVQQGESIRLYPVIAAALDQASWCSNDPVCSEMKTQGVMGLNKAACHSCTLVSETSCVVNNLMLDRKLLLGELGSNGEHGFFSGVLNNIKGVVGA